MVGVDPVMGAPRFTLGLAELQDGLQLVPVAMGLFGIGEILFNAERATGQVFAAPLRSLMLTAQDVRDSWRPVLRGTGIGFFIGLIPGVERSSRRSSPTSRRSACRGRRSGSGRA